MKMKIVIGTETESEDCCDVVRLSASVCSMYLKRAAKVLAVGTTETKRSYRGRMVLGCAYFSAYCLPVRDGCSCGEVGGDSQCKPRREGYEVLWTQNCSSNRDHRRGNADSERLSLIPEPNACCTNCVEQARSLAPAG
jgi:hypothetical protein